MFLENEKNYLHDMVQRLGSLTNVALSSGQA